MSSSIYPAIRIFSALVGVTAFALFLVEGVPGREQANKGKRVSVTRLSRTPCHRLCKDPEKAERKTTISIDPAQQAEDPSVFTKAIDNDIGVLGLRFLASLLLAVSTAVALERLVRGDSRPPDAGAPADPPKNRGSGSGGSTQKAPERARNADDPEEVEFKPATIEDPTPEETKARNREAKRHARSMKRQAEMKERSPPLKIDDG